MLRSRPRVRSGAQAGKGPQNRYNRAGRGNIRGPVRGFSPGHPFVQASRFPSDTPTLVGTSGYADFSRLLGKADFSPPRGRARATEVARPREPYESGVPGRPRSVTRSGRCGRNDDRGRGFSRHRTIPSAALCGQSIGSVINAWGDRWPSRRGSGMAKVELNTFCFLISEPSFIVSRFSVPAFPFCFIPRDALRDQRDPANRTANPPALPG